MSTFDTLDKRLAAKGWRYDADNEQFMNGKHALNYRAVLALIPGMTMDELARYQDQKHDDFHGRRVAVDPKQLKQRTKKKAAKKVTRKKG
jgi:hypothetical protein